VPLAPPVERAVAHPEVELVLGSCAVPSAGATVAPAFYDAGSATQTCSLGVEIAPRPFW